MKSLLFYFNKNSTDHPWKSRYNLLITYLKFLNSDVHKVTVII